MNEEQYRMLTRFELAVQEREQRYMAYQQAAVEVSQAKAALVEAFQGEEG